MNLYSIDVEHSGPKDQHIAIQGYVLAENDEAVYEWLKTEPELNGVSIFNSWKEKEDENEPFTLYDDKYNSIGEETFKERMLRVKSQFHEDMEYDYSDAYYGHTLYGWSLVEEDVILGHIQYSIEIGLVVQI